MGRQFLIAIVSPKKMSYQTSRSLDYSRSTAAMAPD
jgi:hypothetical protein